VFTAGIGENSALVRRRVCEGLAWLNVAIDPPANERNRLYISQKEKVPSVWVIPTDEEIVIANHTLAVIRSNT
jgi:acetate kinase